MLTQLPPPRLSAAPASLILAPLRRNGGGAAAGKAEREWQSRSLGLAVARAAGFPPEAIADAAEVLRELEGR